MNILAITLFLFFFLLIIIAAVAMAVLQIIAMWKIFIKAGEPGWKSIIPCYSIWTLYKFTWTPGISIAYMILAIQGSIMVAIAQLFAQLALLSYDWDVAFVFLLIALVIVLIGIALGLAAYVIQCIAMHKLSLAFGHGGGFTVGLIFLPTIFLMILAFGQSQYVGNSSLAN